MSQLFAVSSLLIDIEAELRQLNGWQIDSPPVEALSSQQPFCIDTLSFPQWLQFIFLPRMHVLVDQQQSFPGKCSIAPMAEEHFKAEGVVAQPLIMALGKLDKILSE